MIYGKEILQYVPSKPAYHPKASSATLKAGNSRASHGELELRLTFDSSYPVIPEPRLNKHSDVVKLMTTTRKICTGGGSLEVATVVGAGYSTAPSPITAVLRGIVLAMKVRGISRASCRLYFKTSNFAMLLINNKPIRTSLVF